ncbi:helix-turn-helix domain-containing protein [Enterococcus quebecensis]|uniref:HTH cro/C1-type domain-containing protein n=1 Tax=Enterococcus quebecensis TaxID=903983 RepID=A0A1E5GVN2_9ENTE|nr:helix-turn-helix transcriptional regulator [Enterococcus quebecensis]OEG16350.1 hypothetical protein BCR23_05530 [Enterococcus quebecensis]OJG72779.1 hypothetical protein RV12_GL000877 [Enterococcus quebecensis]
MTIGENIRYWRKKRRLTQKQLCNLICSQSQLSKIERDCEKPSIDIISDIAKKLNISILNLVQNNDSFLKSFSNKKKEILLSLLQNNKKEYHHLLQWFLRFSYNREVEEAYLILYGYIQITEEKPFSMKDIENIQLQIRDNHFESSEISKIFVLVFKLYYSKQRNYLNLEQELEKIKRLLLYQNNYDDLFIFLLIHLILKTFDESVYSINLLNQLLIHTLLCNEIDFDSLVILLNFVIIVTKEKHPKSSQHYKKILVLLIKLYAD